MKHNKNKSHLFDVIKLDKSLPSYEEIMALHKRAIEKNEDIYIDPKTGYQVFTAAFLLEKGYCCGSGCRHCPY